jgi:hypothetical protein
VYTDDNNLLNSSWKEKMIQRKDEEKIKTRFIFNNCFFENPAFYDTMWNYIVQHDRPQVRIKYRSEE